MRSSKVIRDPIHGNVPVNELELRLLDTPHVQRLRNIRQNGLCYLVYPAMNSTRFEHSLGVMHLGGVMADHLELSDEDNMILRVAGLLHDIGHAPLSHTFEALLERDGFLHEEVSARIIEDSEISDILGEYGIKAGKISGLILGDGPLGKILSSEIDVDKMDYLIRDAHYAGVTYGVIDLERIVYSLRMVDGELVVGHGGLEAAESLLISRNLMYETVYRHHTKRIAESMIVHAVEDLLDKEDMSIQELVTMDDIGLFSKLRSSRGYARDMMDRIDDRRLFKKFFEERLGLISPVFQENLRIDRRVIEDKIASDYKIRKGYVNISFPDTKFSEFKVKVEHDGGLKYMDEVSNLARALESSEKEKLTLSFSTPGENMKKLDGFIPEEYIEYTQKRLSKYS